MLIHYLSLIAIVWLPMKQQMSYLKYHAENGAENA